MKLTITFVTVFFLHVSATTFGQNITITNKNVRLEKVLNEIEKQTGYTFWYKTDIVKQSYKVSLDIKDQSLENTLEACFKDLPITYKIVQKTIVLSEKTAKGSGTIQVDPIVVKGKVTDEQGASLPGATIKVKGTNTATSTDVNGNFSITVPDKTAVLVVSFVGYNAQEITVGDKTNFNVSLTAATGSLNSVVVTALNIKREARSLGYSVQSVSGNEVVKADPPNISEGLMGKVSGLNITVPNGVEGASTRIVIRGNNNLFGNNQPLIVVDNVVIDNEPLQPGGKIQSNIDALSQGTTDVSQPPTDFGSFLNTVNPDDIESVNVLKGPTAAALYGARGANGVILIVTKKGAKKKGFGVDYNYSIRWNDPYRFIQTQHEFGNGMTEDLYSANPPFYTNNSGQNREEQIEGDPYGPLGNIPGAYVSPGVTSPAGGAFYNYIGFPGDGSSWGPRMSGQPLVWWDGTTRPYTPNSNIFQSFYKTGNTQTQNISVSGGGDLGTMRASYTRTTNDAITYNSNSTTNTLNLGSSINVSQKVKVDATASYINLDKYNPVNLYAENGSPGSGNGNIGVGYMTVYNIPADYKPIEKGLTYNPDGSRNTILTQAPWGYGQQYYWWNLYNNITTFSQNQLIGSISVNGEITSWLRASGNVGLNYYTTEYETKNKPYDPAGLLGSYSNDVANVFTENLDGRLVFHKEHIARDFNASLSVGARKYYTNLYDLSASNPGPFNYPFIYNLNNYSGPAQNYPRPTENRNEMEINSVYGLANLSYKDYLFLDLSGTNDWSSTLRPTNWSYFYPSASLSFVFTDAFDLGSVKNWLSYGKLRVSEATSANAYLPYQNGLVYNSVSVPGFQTGLSLPTTYPTNIGPQRSKSFEIGPDLGFFNDRLNVNFTYYNTYSDHQILTISVANSSGLNSVLINSGALRNRGIEFSVNAKVIKTDNFGWDVTVNGAHNQNKVVSLAPGINYLPLGSWFGGDGVSMRVNPGDNYGDIYGYDYKYKNGQKVVNLVYADGMNTGNGPVLGAQYATSDDIVKIGNATPKLTGGISQTFRYKNISLYVLTDFKIGGQIWSGDYATIMGQGMAPETAWERDGHGLPYTFPDGTKANVGVILPGVALNPATGQYQQNTAVVNSWWKYAGNYQSWDNVPVVRTNSIFTDSWGKLREVAITYALPKDLVAKTKMLQNLSVSLVGRDLFYLFTTLPDHINPESIVGTSNVQGIQFGGLPGVRSYGFSVRAGF
ncbi:MAG: SusC/RagA family TonB-linked outer membrane protein [Bacteroidetes bacterium]|nr:SusC/RagA family TonB-linked outer membrane protein [Bacteroidota bacterium]